jgi:transcriptional regulator
MKKRLKVLSSFIAFILATSNVVPAYAVTTDDNVAVIDGDTTTSPSALVSSDSSSSNLEAYAADTVVYGDYDGDGDFDEDDLTGIQTWLADTSHSNVFADKEVDERLFNAMDIKGKLSDTANDDDGVREPATKLYRSDMDSIYEWLTAKLHNGKLLPCDVGDAYRWGDADGDGKVQMSDGFYARDTALNLPGGEEGEAIRRACDFDDDGRLTANDASVIFQYLLSGYENSPLFYIEAVNPTVEYAPGATLEDITIKRTYEDESTQTNKVSELNAVVTIDGESADDVTLTEGEHTVKVQHSEAYGGSTIKRSTSFTINVVKKVTDLKVTEKTSKNYIEGNSLDKTNYTVTAVYNDGTTAIVTDYTTDKDGKELKTSDNSVTFTYEGKSVKMPITVKAKSLIGIEITTPPDKTGYIEGNTFDPTGMVVKAVYDNDTTEEITDYKVPTDKLTLGQDSVTVSYKDFTANQSINVAKKTAKSLTIVTPPDKTKYIEGTAFDPTGMVVQLTYDNGDEETIDNYTYPTDNFKLGDDNATIGYKGLEVAQPITVVEKSLVGIEITTPADKTSYIEGNTFDPTGMVVTAKYDNDTAEAVTDYTVPTDKLTLGQDTVTVIYKNFTDKQPVEVRAKSLVGIKISTPPTKTTYIEGNTFDPTDMVVDAVYDNDDVESITDYTVPEEKLTLDDTSVTVSYKGFTAEQSVSVEKKSAVDLVISTPPDTVDYIEGTPFDPTGMVIEVIFDNGDVEPVIDYVYPKENLISGTPLIPITYGDLVAEQAITVRDKSLVGINITKEPNKVKYLEGTVFEKEGMEVEAVYDNGTTEKAIDYTVPTDKLVLGQTDVTVTYQEKTALQLIEVIKKSLTGIQIVKSPDKTDYIEGNTFDPTGMVVKAIYDNGDEEEVTDYTTPTDGLTAGQTSATISYNGVTADQPITVSNKTLVGIQIVTPPDKTTYVEGTDFDPTGMQIEATYDNGFSEPVTDYTFPDEALVLDQKSVEISFDGKTAEQPITVTTKSISSIYIVEEPDNTEYTEGDSFDPTGMILGVVYDNGDEETVDTGFTYPLDDLVSGQTSIEVSYNGATVDQAISVESTTTVTTAVEDSTETTTKAVTKSSGRSTSGGGRSSSKASTTATNGKSSNTASESNDADDVDVDSTHVDSDVPAPETDMFTDIANSYARTYINELAKAGIINGYPDGTFRPGMSTKRGDVAIIIQKLSSLTGVTATSFNDVPAFSYYASAIGATTKSNLMIGYGNGTFKPENTVSREEMFVIIAKIANVDYNNANVSVLNKFNDSANVADWAKPYAAALVNAGIVSGDNGSLRPKSDITRAELAVLIYQISER